MNIKSVAKDLLPPVFIKWAKGIHDSNNVRQYDNYSEALADSSVNGYEASDVVKVVICKNKIFADKLHQENVLDLGSLRTMIGVGLCRENSLRVLDFGGGGGYHYQIAKMAFGNDIDLHWCVVETPSMAQEAERQLASSRLRFASSLDEAKTILGEVNLIFSSGTLHCTDDPLKYLAKLLSLEAKKIFLTRTSFSEDHKRMIFLQKSRLSHNGPGALPQGFQDADIFYPNVFVPISEVKDLILRSGYTIRLEINEDSDVYKFGENTFSMYGFLCEKCK